MPSVTTKTHDDLVTGQATVVQAQASGLVDFSLGSILRAIAESVSDVALWLQGLILLLLANTRAATSTGADLDTWLADYGFVRLAATTSSGSLTFGRFSTSGTASILAGAIAQTADGSQQFTVIADVTNGAWNAGLGAYVMNAGVGSLTVKAQSVKLAAAANALAGTIVQITGAIPGVDTVTNTLAFAGGSDAEADASARSRFQGYLASLSKGTVAALTYLVNSIQTGLFIKFLENVNYAGATVPGNFVALVDDGSGAPPGSLLTLASLQIDAARPITTTFSVNGPVVVTANVAMTVTVSAGFVKAAVAALIQAAITNYVNATGFGAVLPLTKLTQLAYEASTGVANVSAVTLNTATSDLTATSLQVIRAGSFAIATP